LQSLDVWSKGNIIASGEYFRHGHHAELWRLFVVDGPP